MKKTILLILVSTILYSCKEKEKTAVKKDNRIYLQTDTLNVVKMTDTMAIAESTCRGCAMESSTAFTIKDTLGIVKLESVETQDNSPAGMTGGNVSKTLVIVPVKAGITTMKMYKFWEGIPAQISDSLAPTETYQIEVQN